MTVIDFRGTQKEVLGDVDLNLEEFNVQLIARIEGRANPQGKPTHMPVKVAGMIEVAQKMQPEKRIKLKDENGTEREQVIDYHTGVKTSKDLVDNFTPDQVVNRMMEDGELFGLLRRLRIKNATLEQLRKGVEDGEFSAETIAAISEKKAEFEETLRTTIDSILASQLPENSKNQLIEAINQIQQFLAKQDGEDEPAPKTDPEDEANTEGGEE